MSLSQYPAYHPVYEVCSYVESLSFGPFTVDENLDTAKSTTTANTKLFVIPTFNALHVGEKFYSNTTKYILVYSHGGKKYYDDCFINNDLIHQEHWKEKDIVTLLTKQFSVEMAKVIPGAKNLPTSVWKVVVDRLTTFMNYVCLAGGTVKSQPAIGGVIHASSISADKITAGSIYIQGDHNYIPGNHVSERSRKLPGMDAEVMLPCACQRSSVITQPLYYAVQHLNDAHDNWNRERIADWLDKLHDEGLVDLEFKVEVDEPESKEKPVEDKPEVTVLTDGWKNVGYTQDFEVTDVNQDTMELMFGGPFDVGDAVEKFKESAKNATDATVSMSDELKKANLILTDYLALMGENNKLEENNDNEDKHNTKE